MRKKDINTVFVTISVLLLFFGLLYGVLFFGMKKTAKKDNTNNVITNDDIKDKNVKYNVKEMNINAAMYNVLNNKYLEKIVDENTYLYTDLNNKNIIENSTKLYVGCDGNLYDVTYEDNNLTISSVYKTGLIPVISVHKDSNFNSLVYYYDDFDTDNICLVGYVLTEDNVDTLYYIHDKKVQETELKNNYVLGDYYYDEMNVIVTHDTRYIVTSTSGHSSSDNPQVLDMLEGKLLLADKYDDIITDGNSMFIASKNDKSTIIDLNGNTATIPYDFIERVYNYYLVSRDNKMAILDDTKKVISDFSIPYSGLDHDYHSFHMRNYVAFTFDNRLVIIPLNAEKEKEELYYLKDDKKIAKITDDKFYMSSILYSYNEESNSFRIYDDKFQIKYEIVINDHFYGIPYYELTFDLMGNNLVLSQNDKRVFFDYETGHLKDNLDDFELNYTDSIKIKVHPVIDDSGSYSTFSIYINNKEYPDYNYSKMNFNDIFKKIGKTYYIFGDNKFASLTKEK